jgi:hypothetical protein
MTEEEASIHIQECEERLKRASKTQQGIVIYTNIEPASRALRQAKPAGTISYPAH